MLQDAEDANDMQLQHVNQERVTATLSKYSPNYCILVFCRGHCYLC